MINIIPEGSRARETYLLDERKTAIRTANEFLELKKYCEKVKDIENARFFRDCVSAANKRYRAITYVIPWVCSTIPGDCVMMEPSRWPLELIDDINALLWETTNI